MRIWAFRARDTRWKALRPQGLSPINLIILIGFIYAAYFILRYGGLWTENDTSVFTKTAQMTIASHNAITTYYSHGFGYTDWLSTLSLLTGLPVQTVNTVVLPFVGMMFLLIPAYSCYRSLLIDPRMALLATLVLLGVPELMFSSLRGNHEKLNIVFLLVSYLALVRAFRATQDGHVKETIVWTALYYVMVYGNVSVNDYFGSTMTFANIPALLIMQMLARRRVVTFSHKLALSIITSMLVVILVMFFVFPAEGSDFSLLRSASAKIHSLFLTMQPSSNPYSSVTSAWASQTASHLMSLFREALFGCSFLVLCAQLWRLWVRKRTFPMEHLLLMSLYLSFGLIIMVSIPVDMVGLAAGSNLEVRNYTYFTVLGAPMIAWGIVRLADRWERPWLTKAFIQPIIIFFIIVGVTKTTLDPLVSNNWIFYTLPEKQAIEAFMNRSPSGTLWTGPDNRLTNLAEVLPASNGQNTNIVGFNIQSRPQITDILWSPQINAYMADRHDTEPNYAIQDIVYDNGSSQIYHRRPLTGFQH